jgi:hypothetical protein
VTKLNFTLGGQQVIGSLKPTDWDGSADDDAVELYALMNVPEQDSFLGKGKAVKDAAQFLTLTCARESKQCSIILRKSENTKIDLRQKTAVFSVKAAGSSLWREQFHLPEGEDFLHFITTDQKFELLVADDVFTLKMRENP